MNENAIPEGETSGYNAKIGLRSGRGWGLIVLYFAASALGGCRGTVAIEPAIANLVANTETPAAVQATIRLTLDEDTRSYVWKGNVFSSFPYKVEFGKALAATAPKAFGRAFEQVQYAEASGTTDALDVRTVILKLLNVDVSAGVFTFTSGEAFVRLQATVVSRQGDTVCTVTAEGTGVQSPGWLGVIGLGWQKDIKAYAVAAACAKAVAEALERIVDQTVACW